MIVKFKGKNCELEQSKYVADNSIALMLVCGGEKFVTCTCYIENAKLKDGEVAIKNYSENEGVFEALIEAGVIEDTGKKIELDYGTHSITFPIGKVKLLTKNR